MIFQHLKELIVAAFATVSGWLAGTVYGMLQAVPEKVAPWYESPAVVAAAVTSGFLLLVKLIDRFDKRKERADERDDEEDARHQTLSEKMAEMTQRSWQTYLHDLREFHGHQLAVKDAELLDRDVTVFRYRRVSHQAFNEVQRLHGRIRQIEVEYAKCSGMDPLPEFEFLYQEEIFAAVEEEVVRYRETLRKNLVAAEKAHSPEPPTGVDSTEVK